MNKLLRFILPLTALIAVLLLLRTPDTDLAAMTAKYTNAESRFVENAQGLRVHYRDQGNPDGAPIVLLHGTASSLHTWEPLIGELGDRYRIITYTQPGHGLTGAHPADDYTFAGMADALDLVTEELGLDHFVLGGNSMGGWVAWRYALAYPERIDALILLDAAGMPLREGERDQSSNLGFRLVRSAAGRFVLQYFTPRRLVEISALQSVTVKSSMDDASIDRYWELLRLPGMRRAAALRATADREAAMADRAGEITAPALILWGEDDQLVGVSAAQTFAERLPDAEVVIYEGVGHLPMEEAPARTARDIDVFLRNVLITTRIAPRP